MIRFCHIHLSAVQPQEYVQLLLQREEDPQSVPFCDLQNTTPSTLRNKLISEGKLLLTVNNKPIAVMMSRYAEDTQDIARIEQ